MYILVAMFYNNNNIRIRINEEYKSVCQFLKKAYVEIVFLIRIKKGVRQSGLECEAFAMCL